jgi:hypothetical protein
VKSRDAIERELSQAILSACQLEQDNGNGFVVPSGTLPDLLPSQRLSASDARYVIGITDRIWTQELRHHLMVREIVHGARPRSQHAR